MVFEKKMSVKDLIEQMRRELQEEKEIAAPAPKAKKAAPAPKKAKAKAKPKAKKAAKKKKK